MSNQCEISGRLIIIKGSIVREDPYLYEIYNENHSEDEDRFVYIGSVMGQLILFVVTADRDNKTRIISARKATNKERKYYENIKKLQEY